MRSSVGVCRHTGTMGTDGEVDPPDAEPEAEAPDAGEEESTAAALIVDPACVAWVKERVQCPGITPEKWSAEHDATLGEFLSTPTQRRLLAFVEPEVGLVLQFNLPQEAVAELQYMLKPHGVAITMENISKSVQYGVVRDSPVSGLLRLMSGAFVPLCLKDGSWPETIKKDFSGQLQKFMASLTETAWDAQGKTMLYIPMEHIGRPEEAAKQKDLVQRLESTLIHWTRQIKEVIDICMDSHMPDQGGAPPHEWIDICTCIALKAHSVCSLGAQPNECIPRPLRMDTCMHIALKAAHTVSPCVLVRSSTDRTTA